MNFGRKLVAATIFLALCSLSGDHIPDRAYTIRLNEEREGTLTQSDPLRPEPPRGPQHRWYFEGQAGQDLTITARSFEFDTYLILLDPHNRPIAWNDDEGWFFNAEIQATLPATGRYTVIVCGATADDYGSYRLSLRPGHHETRWYESAARAYYHRGLQWAERRHSQRAVSLLNLALGQHLRERRQWEQAETYYARSRAAAVSPGFLFGQWAVALERGTMLTDLRRYDEALDELEHALTLSARLRSSDEAKALVHAQLGDLYHFIQKRDLAELHYRKALALAERSGSPTALVRICTSLYAFYSAQSREKALEYARRAYALREKVGASQKLRVSYMLASSFNASGKFEDGLPLTEEARRMAHRLGRRAEEISLLTLMSMTYFKLNRVDDVVRAAADAVALTDPDERDTQPRRIALQMQATGEMIRGNYEEALRLCLEAWRTTESAWMREPTEELQEDFLAQSKAISAQILRILSALNTKQPSREYIHQAFNFAERSRSRGLLVHLAAKHRPQPMVDPEVLGEERRLLEQISALGRRIVLARAGIGVDGGGIGQLEEERARLMAERLKLGARIRGQAVGLTGSAISPLTAEEVKRQYLAAYPNAAVLFYQLGIQESYLIVLTRRGEYLFKLPDWTTIGKAVAEWQAQIRRQMNPSERTVEARRDYERIARHLYEMLVKPAAPAIRGRDLIIVPDRALHSLAFEALVVGGDTARPRYLVEEHAVTYAPSISVLAEIERRPTSPMGKKVLLVGDPGFTGTPPVRGSSVTVVAQKRTTTAHRDLAGTWDRTVASRFRQFLGSLLGTISPWVGLQPTMERTDALARVTESQRFRAGLQRIPSTQDEVRKIARLAAQRRWQPTVWLGREASKDKFTRANLASYRLLHLATHGVADEKDGGLSALVLSGSGREGQNDWVLTAAEIARLKINADLVVLSGCETSAGQTTSGEGVIGLARAFMAAGARRVCGSLWKVEDTSAEKLMVTFYREMLGSGLGPSRALQRAKIAFLRQGAWPFSWAPFVLIGSPK